MFGPAKLILAGTAVYATVLVATLAYVYIRKPGHGAISLMLPPLVLLMAAMVLVVISAFVGAYQLATAPDTRTRKNVSVVVVGFMVGAMWLVVTALG